MEFEQTVRERIAELGLENSVLLSTDFLPPEEAALFLQLSDLIVLAYGPTAESSSAAVRFALGAQRPVITTAGAIFTDVAGSTLQIESNSPQNIATAIRNVLRDASLAERLARKAHTFVEETKWDKVSADYVALLHSLSPSGQTSRANPLNSDCASSRTRPSGPIRSG